MSQEKVNKYKDYKKNRRENLAKEKRRSMLERIAAWSVIALIIIGVGVACGVSAYNSYKARLAAMPTYDATNLAIGDYSGILSGADGNGEAEAAELETEAESEVQELVSEAEELVSEAVEAAEDVVTEAAEAAEDVVTEAVEAAEELVTEAAEAAKEAATELAEESGTAE